MIRYSLFFFIILIFLKKILILESFFIWDHLYTQKDEYNRLKSPSTSYYIVEIDIDKLSKESIEWDWDLRNSHIANPFPASINIKTYTQPESENKSGLIPNLKKKKNIFNNEDTTSSRNQFQSPTCISFVISELFQNTLNIKQDLSAEYIHNLMKKIEKEDSKLNSKEWHLSKRGIDKPSTLWRSIQIVYQYGLRYDNIKYKNLNKYPIITKNKDYKTPNFKITYGKFIYFYRNKLSNNQDCIPFLKKSIEDGPIAVTVTINQKSFNLDNLGWRITNNPIDINSGVANFIVGEKQAHAI